MRHSGQTHSLTSVTCSLQAKNISNFNIINTSQTSVTLICIGEKHIHLKTNFKKNIKTKVTKYDDKTKWLVRIISSPIGTGVIQKIVFQNANNDAEWQELSNHCQCERQFNTSL